jgi:preprotein translocase subunit SecA
MYAKLVTVLTPSSGKKKVSKGFLNELLKDMKDEEEENDDSGDYYIDEKSKTVTLSSEGIERLEKLLKVDNLYKDVGYDEIHHIENALRARAVYNNDKEYLVKDGQVMIVDENT